MEIVEEEFWSGDLEEDGYRLAFTTCRDFFAVDNDLLEAELKRLGIDNPKYLEIRITYRANEGGCNGISCCPLFHREGIELTLRTLDILDVPGSREPLERFLDPKYNPLVLVDFSKVRAKITFVMAEHTSVHKDGTKTTTTILPEALEGTRCTSLTVAEAPTELKKRSWLKRILDVFSTRSSTKG